MVSVILQGSMNLHGGLTIWTMSWIQFTTENVIYSLLGLKLLRNINSISVKTYRLEQQPIRYLLWHPIVQWSSLRLPIVPTWTDASMCVRIHDGCARFQTHRCVEARPERLQRHHFTATTLMPRSGWWGGGRQEGRGRDVRCASVSECAQARAALGPIIKVD